MALRRSAWETLPALAPCARSRRCLRRRADAANKASAKSEEAERRMRT